jgi:hypothetical protein
VTENERDSAKELVSEIKQADGQELESCYVNWFRSQYAGQSKAPDESDFPISPCSMLDFLLTLSSGSIRILQFRL